MRFFGEKVTTLSLLAGTLVRELTNKRLKRDSFTSVPELTAAIEDYIANHNDEPKPFAWTKTAEEIIAKVTGGRIALDEAPVK